MSDYKSWLAEKQSAYLYRILAEREKDKPFARLFVRLGEEADHQSEVWKHKLDQQKIHVPSETPLTFRLRVVAWLIRHYRPKSMLGILAAMKIRGLSVYDNQLPRELPPASLEEVGKRHHTAGTRGNLRAAIFGANDGLVSNAALIMGMAGAESSNETVLLAGTAGLLAGAFSMAAGEFISVRSQREMFEYQINLERDELMLYPEEEEAELALIYEARGLNFHDAKAMAKKVLKDPKKALDTMAREELGLNPADLASPFGAAGFSFLAFSIGACIPLLPFFVFQGATATYVSAGAFLASLFGVGIAVSLFTGRSALFSGLRMLTIGLFAAGVTYLVGSFFNL